MIRLSTSTCHFLLVLTVLCLLRSTMAAIATATGGDILDEVILQDIFSTQLGSMTSQCNPATNSTFSFEFDFDAVDHTGKNWADDSTGNYNAAAYERDNFLVSLHHQDVNPNRTWTAGISTAGNIYSFRGAFGEASPPQTQWHPDDKGSLWVDDVPQMGVVADTRTDTSPSGVCYNHPNPTNTLNYNIECNCQDSNGSTVSCSDPDATVVSKTRLVNNFAHQGGVYSRDMDEDINGNPYLFKTQNGVLTGKPFFSPNIATHCEGNTCAFGTWGQQAHTPTPWRSAVLYFSRFADCGDGVLEFSQAIYNDGDSAGALGSEVYNYGNAPWGGVRSSTLPKLLVSSKDHALDFSDDQVELLPWGQAGCEGKNGACNSKLCMDVSCTAGFTTFTQDIPPPPIPYDKVCIDPTTGSVTRSATCGTGLNEFNPVMYNNNPCGPGYARPTRARCNVNFPQGNNAAATAAAVSGVNAIKCQTCRLIITVTRPGVADPITEFTITNLDHFTYTDGTNYANHFIYFDPLALAGNAGDGSTSTTAATAWANDLNTLLLAGDVFNLSYDTEGGVDTDDALALTFIHGKDTTTNGGISWERNRAGISQRDFTVWTVNPIGISLGPQDTYEKQMYFSTDELTNVASTAAQWVDKTDEEFVDDPSQFNGRSIQLYSSGNNDSFGAAVADAPLGTSTLCPNKGSPVCSGWSTPKAGHKALFYIECGTNSYVTADQYHFAPSQPTFGDDLNYANDDPIRSYVCNDLPGERPTWKLLGFFPEGDCASLANSSYDSALCSEEVDLTPSSSPSVQGSNAPSVKASPSPSSAPTQCNQPTDCVSESGCCVGSCHGDLTCHFVCGCDGLGETCENNICVTSSPSPGPSQSPSVTGSSSPSVTGSNSPSTVASQPPSVSASANPTVEESSPPSVTSSQSPSVTGSSSPSISASASPSSSPTSSEGLGTCSNNGAVCSETANCNCPTARRLVEGRDLQACQGPGEACGGKNGSCCSGSQCINFGGGRKECSTPTTSAPISSSPTSSAPTALPTNAPVFSPPTSDAPTPGPVCECVFPSESPSSSPSATATETPTKLPTTSAPTKLPTTSSPTVAQACIIRGDPCSGPGDTNCCGSDSCSLKGKNYKCGK